MNDFIPAKRSKPVQCTCLFSVVWMSLVVQAAQNVLISILSPMCVDHKIQFGTLFPGVPHLRFWEGGAANHSLSDRRTLSLSFLTLRLIPLSSMLSGWVTDDSADIADALKTDKLDEKQVDWYDNHLLSLIVAHVALKSHQTR